MPKPPKPRPLLQEVKSYVTPKASDVVFFVLRDSTIAKYKNPVYGSSFPDTNEFPNHKLIFVSPSDKEEPHIQKWYYGAIREDQDLYNFEKTDEKVTREYIIPRADFLGGNFPPPEFGAADPTFPGYNYVDEDVKKTGDSMLDTYFVLIERTYANLSRVVAESETGTGEGEGGSQTTIGFTQSATAQAPGIVVSRQSTLSEDKLWRNTENRLTPRLGVYRRSEQNRGAGFTEVSTQERSLTEPEIDEADTDFSKNLVLVNAEGADALWEASRSFRENAPSEGSELSRFLGGGVATVALSLVPEATPAPAGFLVIESEVKPLGGGQSVQVVKSLPEFPVLIDYKYDNQIEGILKVTKTVVDASTNPTGSIGPNLVTEVQAYDKWRSIVIQTEGVGVASTTMLPGVFQFQFPPVLKSMNWLGAYAYAFFNDKLDYDFDTALIFNLVEAMSIAVNGRIIRVVTNDPSSVIGDYPPVNFQPQSHTIGFSTAAWFASDAMLWAKTAARTWQTPLAIHGALSAGFPSMGPGEDTTVQSITSIPATSPTNIPSGWTTIAVSVNKLNLGYYEVLVKQIDSPGPV